ncbi:MAG: hypothetical protein M3N41_01045 [Acidobacteriota bacterium]|nr:hypothetical protein [Acidobacteriota bacterium]
MTPYARFPWLALMAMMVFSRAAMAQGGPPFLSDDPDTPGNHHWEVNMGFLGERSRAGGAYQVPDIDINFGLGHPIQLKFELPLAVTEARGPTGHVDAGLGNSLLGIKYRFYAHHSKHEKEEPPRERESNFALSVYPQLALNNPTASVARGIVDPGPEALLPLEAKAILGPIRISAEVGYWLTKGDVPNSWIRGAVVGHEFKKDTELYMEIYDQRDVSGKPRIAQTSVGLGGRVPIVPSGMFRLIAMGGHDFAGTASGRSSWIAYVGIQFLSDKRRRHSSDVDELDLP